MLLSSGSMGSSNDRRASTVSYLAGVFVSAGFWVLVDAGVQADKNDDPQQLKFEFVLPAIFSVVAMWLLNAWSWDGLQYGDPVRQNRCKIALFTSLIIHFACIFGALWVLIGVYSGDNSKAESSYGGLAVLVSCIATFTGSAILRLGRMDNM